MMGELPVVRFRFWDTSPRHNEFELEDVVVNLSVILGSEKMVNRITRAPFSPWRQHTTKNNLVTTFFSQRKDILRGAVEHLEILRALAAGKKPSYETSDVPDTPLEIPQRLDLFWDLTQHASTVFTSPAIRGELPEGIIFTISIPTGAGLSFSAPGGPG